MMPSNHPSSFPRDPSRTRLSICNSNPGPSSEEPPPSTLTKNVTVEVSGSRFCIIPSLFKHIETLHWKRNGDTLRLNADPDVFEMILQYFMFSSLPDYSGLSHLKASELLELIKPLEGVAAQRLTQYVEHYIVTTPAPAATSSSFLRRRLPSFSSMPSRNKTKASQNPSKNSNVTENQTILNQPVKSNVVANVPSHFRAQAQHFWSNKSQSSLPTSVVRSNSCSSDGSISKLSQPSSHMGLQGQDENIMSHRYLGEDDDSTMVDGPQTHKTAVEPFPFNDVPPPPSFSQGRSENFEFVGTYPTTVPSTPTKMLSETTTHNHIPQPKPQVLGNSEMQLTSGKSASNKKVMGSKTLFRNVFGSSNKGDRGKRKMTHADWCSSEYVL
ncbi:hypothetical protein IV203_035773 [Nitzschia inconspicua]|uniref:BTB domain-containing protein n=1 Tax=Nitzschia inconspicua TaxID=303405 RepID=A0A9K3PXG6_9STRA|nr:hypothetical protein IV203_035773 [Nitzschia inconspicua]